MMTRRQERTCERLRPLLDAAGARHGYPTVAVSFARTAELRVRWERGWADDGFDFSVTYPDYVDDAPPQALADLAEACMVRTVSLEPFRMPLSMREFLEDDGFHLRRRAQYIARSRTLSRDTAGLETWADDLRAMGLDPGDTVVMWDEGLRMTPRVSPAMRVVGLPKALRLAKLSPQATLLMAWAGVCRADPRIGDDDERLQREISRFPGRGVYESRLNEAGLMLRWGRRGAWTHPIHIPLSCATQSPRRS